MIQKNAVLCILSLVLVPSVVSAQRSETEEFPLDQGWNKKYAVVIEAENPLTDPNFFDEAGDGLGIGGRLQLDPMLAVRVVGSIRRNSNTPVETRTETSNGEETQVTFEFDPPGLSSFGFDLVVDGLYRFGPDPVSAYGVGGAYVDYGRTWRNYEDSLSVPDQIVTVDDRTDDFEVGLRGGLGIDWRISESFSLFVEYIVQVSVWSNARVQDETFTETTVDGQRSVLSESSKSSTSSWFDVSTTLEQDATVGVNIFF